MNSLAGGKEIHLFRKRTERITDVIQSPPGDSGKITFLLCMQRPASARMTFRRMIAAQTRAVLAGPSVTARFHERPGEGQNAAV